MHSALAIKTAALLIGSLLVASLSQAQSSRYNYVYNSKISEGLRAGVNMGNIDGRVRVTDGIQSATLSADMKHELGLTLGYGLVQQNAFGMIGEFQFNEFENVKTYRVAVDGTYGLSNVAYFLGGIHFEDLVADEGSDKFGTGVGVQVGFGAQFAKSFGAIIKYVSTTYSTNEYGLKAELNLSGIEFGLIATF